jgi:hypothetical protein
VAEELARLGFEWFPTDDAGPLARFLDAPDGGLLDRNQRLARRHFSLSRVAEELLGVIATLPGQG